MLVLPLDVANRSVDGGYDMVVLWQILYLAAVIWVIVIVPFAMFYYEAYEEERSCCSQFVTAFCYTLIFMIAFGALTAIMYVTIGNADVPFKFYTTTLGGTVECFLLLLITPVSACLLLEGARDFLCACR